MPRAILLGVAMVAASPLVARAQAGDPGPPVSSPRVAAKLALGFAGTVDVDYENPMTPDTEDDLLVSYGFAAEVGLPVHRFITIGAMVQLLWQNIEDWDDRNFDRSLTLDLDAVFRIRYPITSGTIRIEPYLGVPVGLSFSFLTDDVIQLFPGFLNVETSSNVGWNIGILGGAIFWITDSVGFLGEIGWSHHVLSNEFTWFIAGAAGSADVDAYLDEVAINLGVTVAF